MDSQKRRWIFTDFDITNLNKWLSYKCEYIIVGCEICPTTGREHLQGYIEFKSPKKFSTIKKIFPNSHIEEAIWDQEANIKYCKKDGEFYEKGNPKQQGKRTDLKNICESVLENNSLEDVPPHYFVMYNKGLNALLQNNRQHRNEKPNVHWYYGLAGTGKTKKATEISDSYYIKDGTQWWDGYDQQEVIIIDDFDGKWPYRDLLRLLDRYQYQGQTKGGYVKINSPYIIITCEFSPSHFWNDNAYEQIYRRIDVIQEIQKIQK